MFDIFRFPLILAIDVLSQWFDFRSLTKFDTLVNDRERLLELYQHKYFVICDSFVVSHIDSFLWLSKRCIRISSLHFCAQKRFEYYSCVADLLRIDATHLKSLIIERKGKSVKQSIDLATLFFYFSNLHSISIRDLHGNKVISKHFNLDDFLQKLVKIDLDEVHNLFPPNLITRIIVNCVNLHHLSLGEPFILDNVEFVKIVGNNIKLDFISVCIDRVTNDTFTACALHCPHLKHLSIFNDCVSLSSLFHFSAITKLTSNCPKLEFIEVAEKPGKFGNEERIDFKTPHLEYNLKAQLLILDDWLERLCFGDDNNNFAADFVASFVLFLQEIPNSFFGDHFQIHLTDVYISGFMRRLLFQRCGYNGGGSDRSVTIESDMYKIQNNYQNNTQSSKYTVYDPNSHKAVCIKKLVILSPHIVINAEFAAACVAHAKKFENCDGKNIATVATICMRNVYNALFVPSTHAKVVCSSSFAF